MTDLITPEERAALTLTEHEEAVLERAEYFTTFRLKGRDRREHENFAAALADAAGDDRAMIYAVAPDGASAHLCNGR